MSVHACVLVLSDEKSLDIQKKKNNKLINFWGKQMILNILFREKKASKNNNKI